MSGAGNRDRRDRTISLELGVGDPDGGSRDRGQTAQDFVIGIGVFILAVAFVFSFLPSILTPYDSAVGGSETAQAERIANQIVHDTESVNGSNELDRAVFEAEYTGENLTDTLALRSSEDVIFDSVNVSIETLEGEPVNATALSGGEPYDGQPAASSARIVTVDDTSADPGDCEPACRLEVTVW
ncbi:DUF7287 family protein [Natrarchaeobaculum aegyptiacum]|uniref:Uncharacterized protein n=1 Tax=Natrarchaeobaculum aegyptiacum TaxID=745377 RepID=A0A2Z2HV18_9EURY|nr:hypothetical protein [Natrarchaeobaculum aegyptiacum]ARS88874.1 hypothetical protein B1756_03295 [Natrarchaeobaculum aegyptiacum]